MNTPSKYNDVYAPFGPRRNTIGGVDNYLNPKIAYPGAGNMAGKGTIGGMGGGTAGGFWDSLGDTAGNYWDSLKGPGGASKLFSGASQAFDIGKGVYDIYAAMQLRDQVEREYNTDLAFSRTNMHNQAAQINRTGKQTALHQMGQTRDANGNVYTGKELTDRANQYFEENRVRGNRPGEQLGEFA